jgi:hypothetical protein
VLDLVLSLLIHKEKKFPLSAAISCCSLGILLNWSFDAYHLLLPVFICIASKHLFRYKGKHIFNPSLFAIVCSILFVGEYVSLAPSYQWYGSVESAWVMLFFVSTAALILFAFKINRTYLIVSFLFFYLIQTWIRAEAMEHIIPFATLFVGSLTAPAFYLFTFYMITDPMTSPNNKWEQIAVGFGIAALDLVFHFKLSYYTFFFAGIIVATIRFAIIFTKDFLEKKQVNPFGLRLQPFVVVGGLFVPVLWGFNKNHFSQSSDSSDLSYVSIPSSHSSIEGSRGSAVEKVDQRVQHVAKWMLSVGDAVASADIDQDGLVDLFLTQPLKGEQDQAKLYINKGDFKFEKLAVDDLEPYLGDPQKHGLPSFAMFFDYDNDLDQDLFVGFSFGHSHLFKNLLNDDGALGFEEVVVPFLERENTVCLAANIADLDNDGYLDLFLANAMQQYLPDYEEKVPFNIFDLPDPAYQGDRRMYHFMHESWHNANNGGHNYLLTNSKDPERPFESSQSTQIGLDQTRWSLATGTLDINDDGYTDIVVANDFGRDDWFINKGGKAFERFEGVFYGDIGLDTYKGMNVSIADLDNNAKEDVYISNVHHEMQAEGSLLWMNYTAKNSEQLDLKQRAEQYNLLNGSRFGWGASTADLNLDGWEDVVQANGMVDASWDQKWDTPKDYWYFQAQIARTGPEIHSYADQWADIRGCYIYPNEADRVSISQGGEYFKDAAASLGVTHNANTRAVLTTDLDNDGAIDLLFTNQFGEPYLYQSQLKDKHWLGLQLVGNGQTTNTNAVGSKVWLSYTTDEGEVTRYKEVRLVNGLSSSNDGRMVFGFGDAGLPDDLTVKVKWHNTDVIEEIDVQNINRYLTIRQADAL